MISEVEKSTSSLGMVPKKAWDLIENVIIASIAGCRGGAWSSSIGV
jgi:hypothetical protein